MDFEQKTQQINTPMVARVDGLRSFSPTFTASELVVDGDIVFLLSGQHPLHSKLPHNHGFIVGL